MGAEVLRPLVEADAVIWPATLGTNFTPTSMGALSGSVTTAGVVVLLHKEKVPGPPPPDPTVTFTPAAGVSRLRLSSAARLLMLKLPATAGVQL